MNDYFKKLKKVTADVSLKIATLAAGNASLWGFHQPKEPPIIKKNK